MSDELTDKKFRLYKVNGNPILVRGAGWSPDLFQRPDPQKLKHEFDYVRHMNLNAIRLEGKFENEYYFSLADQMGILTIPGICCCDAWQNWKHWTQQTHTVASESIRTQLKRLRIHASVLVFFYSSDTLPPVDVEKEYLKVIEQEKWPNPVLASASDLTSPITGPTGVKMSGPYSWEPPNYWYKDQYGAAFGFLTEGGPGENPLALESLTMTLPQNKLWPINDEWDYHCANPEGVFRNLRFFTPPLEARYTPGRNVADYLQKSQVAVYETHRAMFEAYSQNKYTSTGVIQWMLNNAWPSNVWHLYDFYLNPTSSYFATKKACEPLHISYDYETNTVYVVNSRYTPIASVPYTIDVYSLHGSNLYTTNGVANNVGPDSANAVHVLPLANLYKNGNHSILFLRLRICPQRSCTEITSENFYWLSRAVDVLDWDQTVFYRTPCSKFSDYSALSELKPIPLQITEVHHIIEKEGTSTITVHNPNDEVAFFIRLRILDNSKDVWPIFWDDNYFSLVPGEQMTVTARYNLPDPVNPSQLKLVVELFNNISTTALNLI